MSTIHVDIVLVEQRARELGFRHATIRELGDGIRLAESLMNSKIATADAVMRMDVVTGMTAWVTGNPIEGVFLVLPLSPAGEQAVRDGTYCPADPAPAHLAWHGRDVAGVYIGVYAGATKEARRAVMTAAAVMRVEQFAAVPTFARGATDDGKRSMASLGFSPLEGGLPDLWVQEALSTGSEAA
ncbi:hypothetical protein [Hyphomonas jannaschiana]|uniref:hypothetical protein n=1 Tax=Hyphomonas jannaschiana TaxID=86 RepID=UPI0012DDCE97|nr:hypothetical protein [Hyphomonas jannaschiana]